MMTDAFKLWTAGWRASLDAAEMGMASAQVIAARMPMMAAAATGDRSHDAELTQMMSEKFVASSAATFGIWEAWAKMATATSPDFAKGAMAVTTASLTPFHKAATANAKRLGRSRKR